jgi:gliding motility-associated-like protein
MGHTKLLNFFVNFWLMCSLTVQIFSQAPIYDDCTKAFELCPNISAKVNNINATKLQFPGSPDVFPSSFCFTANNTIWLKFYSNELGGFGQIVFSSIVFENGAGQDNRIQASILEAAAPCDASTYTQIGNCEAGTSTNFSLSANFEPMKTYYLVLNGAMSGTGITKPAEFSVDVFLTGPGVLRPTPSISIIADKNQICKDEMITFYSQVSNCPDSSTYHWYINNELIAITVDTFFQTSALRKGDVMSVSNSCYQNCKVFPKADVSSFEVIDFVVDAGVDVSINYGETIELNGFTDATIFEWSPLDNLAGKNTLNPKVNPIETTTYFLTADSLNCTYSDAVTVTVGLNLEITNTFTPNGDGYNDTWEIPGLINYPNCLVEIFDRWGQLVFTSSGYGKSKAWDGKKNGKLLNESVYFYVIRLRDNTEKTYRGTVTIIK